LQLPPTLEAVPHLHPEDAPCRSDKDSLIMDDDDDNNNDNNNNNNNVVSAG